MSNSPLNELWGGQVDEARLDLRRQELAVLGRVPKVTQERPFRLDFIEVVDISYHREVPTPWNHAELTEIRCRRVVGQDGVVVDLLLWTEPTEMRVVCQQLLLDGLAVSPTAD